MSDFDYSKQETAMIGKGYASVRIAASKMMVHVATVYRKLESGDLRGIKLGDKQYIEIKSIIEHVGPESAKLLGLVTPRNP